MRDMNSIESRQQLFNDIVINFLNASRGHGMLHEQYGNPIDRLSELAMLLYLAKNNHLRIVANIPNDGDNVLVFLNGKGLRLGNMFPELDWKDIMHIAVINDCDSCISLFKEWRDSMRQCEGQESLLIACKMLLDAHLSNEEYGTLLLMAEINILSSAGHFGGIVSNPQSLATLATRLLSDDISAVYDPFMGLASFATELPDNVTFYGTDINPRITAYVQVKMAILNKNAVCKCDDSLMNTLQEIPNAAIVSFPPMGLRDVNPMGALLRLFEKDCYKEMVLVLSISDCSLHKNYDLRKEFTDKNYLAEIIQLPSRYLDATGISVVALHLKKNRKAGDKVFVYNFAEYAQERGTRLTRLEINPDTFFDAISGERQDKVGQTWVTCETIAERDYDWTAFAYPFEYALPIPRNGNTQLVAMKDIVTRFTAELCEEQHKVLNFRLLKSPFDKPTYSSTRSRCRKLTEPALVVGYDASCMLYYIEASVEHPAYIDTREITYRCATDIALPQYLAYAFWKYVDIKRDMFGGLLMSNVYINRFVMAQHIAFSPVPEQQVTVDGAKLDYQDKLLDEMGIDSEKLKEQYIQEIRARKHNMRPFISELVSSTTLARMIVEKANSLDEVKAKLQPIFNRLDLNCKGLSDIIMNLSQVEKFAEPEVIDVRKFLQNEVERYSQLYPEIDFSFKAVDIDQCIEMGESLSEKTWGQYVFISQYDFDRLVKNIVENARKHGFDGDDKGHHITIEVDYEDSFYKISFSNDGIPFPKGFDINKYGLLGEKAGKNAGTGNGGHQVVEIAHHYNGYVTLDSAETGADNRVTVNVYLPIFDEKLN